MKRHASLNRLYRLVWSELLNTWVAVAETARGRGKAASRKRIIVIAALSTMSATGLLMPMAIAAPVGGQVVSGSASISQSGNTTNIVQTTPNAALNWQGFNIAPTEVVNFMQPSASAIAVNRIMDVNGTQILGQLNANGQVYLINPNGILFGAGAQVNVGGLVASSLDFNDASLNSTSRRFSGNGTGSIINQGHLQAADGGYIALLGNSVSNQGVITAQLGTVALGAGSAVSLNFSGNQLLHLQVEQSTLNNLADNGQLIQADGGRVFMSAGASNSLLASVVNNSGIVQAHTIVERDGQIILLGGMTAGTTNVAGQLDASAPHGGNGGFIETSAAHVNISNDAKITTAAASGLTGSWLIDPVDFTVAASGGNITGASLGTLLNSNSVTIQTATGTDTTTNRYGTTGTNGDIFVNDAISWTAATSLTMNAFRNININQSITASNAAGSLALLYGQGAVAAGNTATYYANAPVNLQTGLNFSTKLGSDGSVKSYNVINSLGVATDATGGAATLQGMAATANLTNNYALGSNIDATATATWNSNTGFTPIGDATTKFSGSFDGLGHTISNLSINRPFDHDLGLFGNASTTASIKNIGLLGGGIYGFYNVGSVAGSNAGSISNSFASTNVYGVDTFVPPWTYNDSYFVGGLVGLNSGTISNTHASGNVSAYSSAGGLVGVNQGASSLITNSYATGNVAASLRYAGGLLGINSGTVSNSYATGSASGSFYVGGLAGINYGLISKNYATGSTNGNFYVGGLAGENRGSISNNFASGKVTGSNSAGGLVGVNSGSVSTSFWDTITTGKATSAGGTGFTTSQMLTQANFTSATADNGNVNPNWDFSNTWYMVDGSTRPFLRMEYNTTISNAHQLQLMGMDLSANYTLANNLDLAAELANPSGMWGTASGTVATGINTNFTPIGNATTAFSGSFDGLGHTISNLKIYWPSAANIGLFGYTSVGSSISNLGLVGGSVYGHGTVGGLVGYNSSNISNSYTTGPTAGYVVTGGLVGYNHLGNISNSYTTGSVNSSNMYGGGLAAYSDGGTITNSYTTGIVTGFGYVGGLVGNLLSGTISNSYTTGQTNGYGVYEGGLVGWNTGAISSSYATGNVAGIGGGANGAGGLVGGNTGAGSISNSYSTGSVTGPVNPGAFVGVNSATISNSFWNSSNNASLGGSGSGGSTGATGLTSVQLLQGNSFSSWGSTINNNGVSGAVWRIYEGHTTPFLTSFMTSLTLADAPDIGASYTGVSQSGATTATTGLLGSAATGTNAGFYNGYYSTQKGYNLIGGNILISPKALTATVSAPNKSYDGTTTATPNLSLTGFVNGETVTASGVATFNTKDVATANLVTVNSTSLADGTNGGLASNYSLVAGQTVAANITAKALSITGISARNKVYDGNRVASLSGSAVVSALGADVVTIAGTGSGLFNDANVGINKAVSVSGYSLVGAAADNYQLLQPMGLTADISAIPSKQSAMPFAAENARLSKTSISVDPLMLSTSIKVIRDENAGATSSRDSALMVFSTAAMQSLQQPVVLTGIEPTLHIFDNEMRSEQPLPWYAQKDDKKL